MHRSHNPPYDHFMSLVDPRRRLQWMRSGGLLSPERRSHGQGFVEFALILPVLLLIMLGIIEFGYVFTAYASLFSAAREGVRYGVVNPMDVSGIVAHAEQKVFLADPGSVDVVVRYDDGPDTPQFTDPARVQIGNRVLVHLTCDLPTITPVIQPIVATFPVHTQAARTVVSLGEGTWDPGSGGGSGDPGEGAAAIALSVTADPLAVESGDPVQFTYVVTNTGDLDLSGVTIVDDFGNTIEIGELTVGANAVWTIVETLTTTTTDNVTATGADAQGRVVIAQDSVSVTVVGAALDVAVTVDSQTIYPGELVNFTYTVTNTGDSDLTGVTVADGFGMTTAPAGVAVGQSVFWQAAYRIYETTVNEVVATGTGPLGSTVSGVDSIMVVVAEELVPIVIQGPLHEGDTVITGTAHAGRIVYIRDMMSDGFPAPASDSTDTLADGTFEFTGLPPLVAGHVILVEAYGQWDSAVVYGDFDPIVINGLCHSNVAIDGTAQPGEQVMLSVVDTGYQDAVTVDADGNFAFALPTDQPLQAGQTVEVTGYGEEAMTVVEPCTTDAYIVISPQCGHPGSTVVTLRGYNWEYRNKNDYVTIRWDGAMAGIIEAGAEPPEWETQVVVDVTDGLHEIGAANRDTPEVTASFLSPCPAPNLVVSDLGLLTAEPLSTYQPLAFSVLVENTGPRPANSMFWVDLYSSQPTTRSTGIAWAAASGLGTGDSIRLTIPVHQGFELTGTYPIWTLADSRYQIVETDEGDNGYGPLPVEISGEGEPPLPPPTGTGKIVGETWVSMTGIPVPHGRTHVRCFDESGHLVVSTTSDDAAKYEISGLLPGTYTLIGETWIDGVRYSRTLDNVIVNEHSIRVRLIILYRD